MSGKSWLTSNADPNTGHHRIVSCCNQTVNTNTRDASKATPKMKIDLSSINKGVSVIDKRSNRFSTNESRGDEESITSSLKSLGIERMRIEDLDFGNDTHRAGEILMIKKLKNNLTARYLK